MLKATRFCAKITGALLVVGIALTGLSTNLFSQPDLQPCNSCHAETYNEWESSGHASGQEKVTCISCHTPHDGSTPSEPVMDPKKLCDSCHPQRAVLQGKGAIGIEDTRSMHSNIACRDCHMTGSNHRMKVLRPDDPDLSEDQIDTCSTCHNIDSRDIRAEQLQDRRKYFKNGMDPLQADLEAVDAALKENPELLNAELKTKLEEIKSNLFIIVDDGSEGLHNLPFSLEIMSLAKRNLKKIKAAIKPE